MEKFKFFVQFESTTESITEIPNKTNNNNNIMSENNINLILNIAKQFKIPIECITNNKKYYNYNVINSLPDETSTTVVHDYNINKYKETKFKNIIFFVHNEKEIFNNFLFLYENFYGTHIDLRLDILSNYNLSDLENELSKLVEFLKTETNIIVPQLNYFNYKEKFRNNGLEYFISPELKVYRHPNYYYTNDNTGYICDFVDFDFLNSDIHLESIPHIICETCHTFYCDRNIYNNKLYTSEYKVPASVECKKTTLLAKYSKMLYHELYGTRINNFNLDLVDGYKHDEAYTKFIENNIIENNIKQYIPNNRIKK